MLNMRTLWRGVAVTVVAVIIAFAASSAATDIVQEWDAVKAPLLHDELE